MHTQNLKVQLSPMNSVEKTKSPPLAESTTSLGCLTPPKRSTLGTPIPMVLTHLLRNSTCIPQRHKKRWQEIISGLDMTQNRKKAWKTIKKLHVDKELYQCITSVTPNQVEGQPLVNEKPFNKEYGYVKKLKE